MWPLIDSVLSTVSVMPGDNGAHPRVPILDEDKDTLHDCPENDEVPANWTFASYSPREKDPEYHEDADSTWNNAWVEYPVQNTLALLE
jgi:hypothetical protein